MGLAAAATAAPADAGPTPTAPWPAQGAVRIVTLSSGSIRESADPSDLPGLLRDEQARTWVDLTDPHPEAVQSVARLIGLHPLVADDIIGSNERAKVEFVDDIIHLVLFALTRVDETTAHEIDFVLGRHFLLSVHTAGWDPESAHQLKLGTETIMGRGLDFLLWALVDGIVDGYFPVFDQFADEIDDLQDEVVADAAPTTLHHLFRLKRELIKMRHVIAPSREVFSRLTSREFDLIADPQVFYFRDVYDNLVRLTDEFDSFRELVAGTLEVYLSTINNNLSVIMKRLTAVTVILAGIAALGGLFGMSEAGPAIAGQEGPGFWIVIGCSVLLGVLGIAFLRRIRWL